jgi:hypothetical protein
MPPVAFKPTIAAGERPYTYALDRLATGTGIKLRTAHHYSTLPLNLYDLLGKALRLPFIQ